MLVCPAADGGTDRCGDEDRARTRLPGAVPAAAWTMRPRRCLAMRRRRSWGGEWDGCVEIGREQVKEGSHTLDICTAFVGRDEIAEMSEIVSRMRGAINAPLVIDSTE